MADNFMSGLAGFLQGFSRQSKPLLFRILEGRREEEEASQKAESDLQKTIREAEEEQARLDRANEELEKSRRGESINLIGMKESDRVALRQTIASEAGVATTKAIKELQRLNPKTDQRDIQLIMSGLDSDGRARAKILFPHLFKTIPETDPRTGVVTTKDLESGEVIGQTTDLSKITKPDIEVIERDGKKVTLKRYGFNDETGESLFVTEKIEEEADSGDPYKADRKHLEAGRVKLATLEAQLTGLRSRTNIARRVEATEEFFQSKTGIDVFDVPPSEADPEDLAQISDEDLLLRERITPTLFGQVKKAEGALELLHEGFLEDLENVVGSDADVIFETAQVSDVDQMIKNLTADLESGQSPYNGQQVKVIVEYLRRFQQYSRMKNAPR